MVTAMRCMRNQEQFPRKVQPDAISDQQKQKIRAVLQVRKMDQSEAWIKLIENCYGITPPEYRLQDWEEDEDAYKRFCQAAVYHRNFMNNIWNE